MRYIDCKFIENIFICVMVVELYKVKDVVMLCYFDAFEYSVDNIKTMKECLCIH